LKNDLSSIEEELRTLKKNNAKALPTIICCIAVNLCVGILYLWSAFKTPVVETYNWTNEAATMVSSYMLFAFVIGLLVGGFIQDKKGPRLTATIGCILFCGGIILTSFLSASNIAFIYLTYCVISGFGCGMTYGSVLAFMQRWMPHRRGLASGIAVAAFGLSTVIFTPLSNAMIGRVEVQNTFRILGVAFLVVTMAACFFVRLPSEEYIKSLNLPASAAGGRNMTLGEASKTLSFWGMFFYLLLLNATWTLAVPLVKDLGLARGLSENLAVLTLTLTGVCSAAGRLCLSALSDKIGRTKTLCLISLVTVACAVCLVFAKSYLYSVAILFAVAVYGAGGAVAPAMTVDLFGPKNSGRNYGVICLSLGASSVLFNAISTGILKGDPAPTFIMGACTAVISFFLMILISSASKKQMAVKSQFPGETR